MLGRRALHAERRLATRIVAERELMAPSARRGGRELGASLHAVRRGVRRSRRRGDDFASKVTCHARDTQLRATRLTSARPFGGVAPHAERRWLDGKRALKHGVDERCLVFGSAPLGGDVGVTRRTSIVFGDGLDDASWNGARKA